MYMLHHDDSEGCSASPPHPQLRWLGVPPAEHWPSLEPRAGLRLGSLSRLAAVGERLRRGCPLRFAALGGSSTAGHALQRWSPALFHSLLLRHINASFPHAEHRHANAGTPGTGPVYMDKCLRYELPGWLEQLDLVTLEYTQNNQYFADKVSLERLIRRLLALPSRPAVVLVSFPAWSQLLPCADGARSGDGGGGGGGGGGCGGGSGRIEEVLVAPLAQRCAVRHLRSAWISQGSAVHPVRVSAAAQVQRAPPQPGRAAARARTPRRRAHTRRARLC